MKHLTAADYSLDEVFDDGELLRDRFLGLAIGIAALFAQEAGFELQLIALLLQLFAFHFEFGGYLLQE